MIAIIGLKTEKYLELTRVAKKQMYRYSCSPINYNEDTGGYDITFSPEISVYIATSYESKLSTIYLLALGQYFITISSTDYKELLII